MTDAERVYLDNLLTVGRVSLHALGRENHNEEHHEQLRTLYDDQSSIATNVVRLTLVLGA